jgi:phosphatidylglycerophosphatase A
MVATVAGVGRIPVASGTFGSLVAVPFLPALATLRAESPMTVVLLVVVLVALAVWSAGRAEEILGGHDHSRIVIDEVAGPGDRRALHAAVVARGGHRVRPVPHLRHREAVSGGADRRQGGGRPRRGRR